MFGQVVLAFAAVLLIYVYKVIKPPPPKICGSPGGPPVTSKRIKLADGRHLSYREWGVSKDEAKHKIIVNHGWCASKDITLPLVSQELVDELKLYFLFYDRPGYGESDPYPKRSVKSEAYDIEALADALQLGSKFYVVGLSCGAYATYSCMMYIPHRLAGVSLVASFVNYWWPRIPKHVSREAFRMLADHDRWTYRMAHYAPWLFYWWMTQRWFPTLSPDYIDKSIASRNEVKITKKWPPVSQEIRDRIQQQGDYESLRRDFMVGFGRWDFSPLDMKNPFPHNEGSVHMWQGEEDNICSFQLNRFISEKLQWIKFHQIPGEGHFFVLDQDFCESMVKELLFG